MTGRTQPPRRSRRMTLRGRAWVTGAVLALGAALTIPPAAAVPGGGHGGHSAGDVLPPLPDGLNVAIGRHVSATIGAAPASAPGAAADGDGSTRWCPGRVGAHSLTVDLGKPTDITGTGVTFSGEEPDDGPHYTVTVGRTPHSSRPFPHQAAGDRNPIVQGPLYLFAGSDGDTSRTVRARYVTLHFQVPHEQNV